MKSNQCMNLGLTVGLLFFGVYKGIAQQKRTDFDRWRVSLSSGYGFRPAQLNDNVPSDFSAYGNKLRHGWVLDGTAYYFLNRYLGIGLHVNRFASSNSLADVYMTDDYGYTEYGMMSDNISITFVGAGAAFRKVFSNGNTFLAGSSLGYIGYLNRFEFNGTQRIVGGNAGILAHAGYDIRLSDHFSIGAKFSAAAGFLSQFTVENNVVEMEEGSNENLSHVNLMAGIRFHW